MLVEHLLVEHFVPNTCSPTCGWCLKYAVLNTRKGPFITVNGLIYANVCTNVSQENGLKWSTDVESYSLILTT